MFQLVTFKIYAIITVSILNCLLFQLVTMNIYKKQSLRGVSWYQLNSENWNFIVLKYIERTSADQLSESMLCFGTSINISILLAYLLKLSLTNFMALVFFCTTWNTSETRGFWMFSGGIRVYSKHFFRSVS